MEETIYTLQEFMLHTENISYIIMGLSLICIVGFWLFLTQTDDDQTD